MAFLGDVKTALSYEVQRQGPIDYRLLKKNKEDLINIDKWPHETNSEGIAIPYVYKTMIVGVESTGELYKLKDVSKMFDSDYSGWELVGQTIINNNPDSGDPSGGNNNKESVEEVYIGSEEPTDENIKVWYNPEDDEGNTEEDTNISISVDSVMSDISSNPVANKTIKAYIDNNSIILENIAPGMPDSPSGTEVQLTNGEYQKILSYLVNNKDKSKSIILNLGGSSYTPISIELGGENNETITMTFIMFGRFKYVLVLTADSENPNNCTATGIISSITGSAKAHPNLQEIIYNSEVPFEDKWNELPEDTSPILLYQNEAEQIIFEARRCEFNNERAIFINMVTGPGGQHTIITESGEEYAMLLSPNLGQALSSYSNSISEDELKYATILMSSKSVDDAYLLENLRVGIYDVHWGLANSIFFMQNAVFDLGSEFSNFTKETSDITSSFFDIYKFLNSFSYGKNTDITFVFTDVSLRALQVQKDSDTQFTLVFKDFINDKTGIMVVTEETTTLTVSFNNA